MTDVSERFFNLYTKFVSESEQVCSPKRGASAEQYNFSKSLPKWVLSFRETLLEIVIL